MRLAIQRVTQARVRVAGRTVGEISTGLLVLVGIGRTDTAADVDYAVKKLRGLRVFDGEDGKGFDRTLFDVDGSLLVVSQFTLYADVHKGRRPSFDAAAVPEQARTLYDALVAALRAAGLRVETGEFQAHMDVELVNDGPVTLILETSRAF
jgi:D-tyrosyl-tRNA(Tyr) deacylase